MHLFVSDFVIHACRESGLTAQVLSEELHEEPVSVQCEMVLLNCVF